MSFQHFRLGDLALQQPIQHNLHSVHHQQQPPQQQPTPQHQHISPQPIPGQSQFAVQIENPITTFSVSLKKDTQQPPSRQLSPKLQQSKQPYGSGDADDGYTLVFASLQEFNDWRQAEEDRTMCEFVKGDTHGSKAVPPRFKDHTKLVCARHSRSGRKKYIKKHPERIRKVPSRKLEVGCPASISYKTYFDTEQVRACYLSQHSHEIGLANLPFTRRGRREKDAATMKFDKDKPNMTSTQAQTPDNDCASRATSLPPCSATNNDHSATSSADVSPQPTMPISPAASNSFSTAVPMLAPLPPQNAYPVPPQQTYTYLSPAPPSQVTYTPAPPASQSQPILAPTPTNLMNDRWERMSTLFQSIREHARNFDYPSPSVAALETILLRLYIESPVGMSVQSAGMSSSIMPMTLAHARGMPNAPITMQASSTSGRTVTDVSGSSTRTEDGS